MLSQAEVPQEKLSQGALSERAFGKSLREEVRSVGADGVAIGS